MRDTLNLLRKSASFLAAHPTVWLPVLVVDVAAFLFRFAVGAARRPILMAVAPRSVTGGLSGGVNATVLTASALLTWIPILLQVAAFVYGMAVCARWAHEIRNGSATSRGWRVNAGPFIRTSLLTFFISTLTVGIGTYLTLRGGVPPRWTPLVTECFLIAASWFVVPAWLRLIAEEQGSRNRGWPVLPGFLAMLSGALGAAIVFLLASLLEQKLLLTSLKAHPVAVVFTVDLAAAVIASLSFAYSFVALSRYAADRPGVWQE